MIEHNAKSFVQLFNILGTAIGKQEGLSPAAQAALSGASSFFHYWNKSSNAGLSETLVKRIAHQLEQRCR